MTRVARFSPPAPWGRLGVLVLLLMAGMLAACGLGTGFQPRGGTYIYATLDESQGYVAHPIENIDAKTFRILSQHGYAKDNQRVYYEWRAVKDADTPTFAALTDLYGKDATRVYYRGKTIPGANPASFALFNIQWGRDAQDVYKQDRPIKACDPASFVLLKEDWQRDSQCAYRMGKKLPDADPASFVVVNYWFGKDKNYVYDELARIIEGADAATFKIRPGICQVCAEDKNRCYRYEKPVACASLK